MKKYVNPILEIVYFKSENVMTSSAGESEGTFIPFSAMQASGWGGGDQEIG